MIVTLIMLISILFILKSGFLLKFLDNIPFIGNVANLVDIILKTGSSVSIAAASQAFTAELLKSITYLVIFAVVDKVLGACFKVGKHEKISGFGRAMRTLLGKVFMVFISALITALIVESIQNGLGQLLGWSQTVIAGISATTSIGLVILAFFIVGKELSVFLINIVVGSVLVSTVKVVAMEFFIIFTYIMLNVPGVFEDTATIVIMLVGISCCIGAVLGVDFIGAKLDKDY